MLPPRKWGWHYTITTIAPPYEWHSFQRPQLYVHHSIDTYKVAPQHATLRDFPFEPTLWGHQKWRSSWVPHFMRSYTAPMWGYIMCATQCMDQLCNVWSILTVMQHNNQCQCKGSSSEVHEQCGHEYVLDFQILCKHRKKIGFLDLWDRDMVSRIWTKTQT